MSGQLPLELGHRPASGRDDFLVSESNRDAVAWIDAWPDWPAPGLVLYGPPACGKSHLAAVWRARARALRITSAQLDAAAMSELLAGPDTVVVEDIDRGVCEPALLHLYNSLAERRGSALLTGRAPPHAWPLALADLRSRVMALPAAGIHPPDDGLMSALLVKLFADRQVRVEPDLISYLSARLDRSFGAADAAVAALDRAGLASGRALTVPLAREALRQAGLLL